MKPELEAPELKPPKATEFEVPELKPPKAAEMMNTRRVMIMSTTPTAAIMIS